MTQPLPIKLKLAEVRMAGKIVSVSVHGITIQTELNESMANAMWERVGARPGRVSVRVQGSIAGAELIRLSDRSRGMRVWIGPMSFKRPLLDRYWDALYQLEMACRNFETEMEVEDVA